MTSTPNLAGKRALVTGGSSGIGATIMRRLPSQALRDIRRQHGRRLRVMRHKTAVQPR